MTLLEVTRLATDIPPGQILRSRTRTADVAAARARVAVLLRVAGGWTFREIAAAFAAYADESAARRAVARGDVDEEQVRQARRLFWEAM